MSDELFKYTPRTIVLNHLKEGDVVTAELWNSVLGLLVNQCNRFDTTLKECATVINGFNNTLTDYDERIKTVELNLTNHINNWNAWQATYSSVLKAVDEIYATYQTVIKNQKEIEDGMVWYGETEPPKGSKYLFWVRNSRIAHIIGRGTSQGGEVFNDYDNNKAGEFAKASGFSTNAGAKYSSANNNQTTSFGVAGSANGENTLAGYAGFKIVKYDHLSFGLKLYVDVNMTPVQEGKGYGYDVNGNGLNIGEDVYYYAKKHYYDLFRVRSLGNAAAPTTPTYSDDGYGIIFLEFKDESLWNNVWKSKGFDFTLDTTSTNWLFSEKTSVNAYFVNNLKGNFTAGEDVRTVGKGSVGGGVHTRVRGDGAIGQGVGLQVIGDGQAVVGTYNEPNPDALFIVGNGTDDANRSNALVVYKDGTCDAKTESEDRRVIHLGTDFYVPISAYAEYNKHTHPYIDFTKYKSGDLYFNTTYKALMLFENVNIDIKTDTTQTGTSVTTDDSTIQMSGLSWNAAFVSSSLGVDTLQADVNVLKANNKDLINRLEAIEQSSNTITLESCPIDVALDDDYTQTASAYLFMTISLASGVNIFDFVIDTPVSWVNNTPTLRYPWAIADWITEGTMCILSTDFTEIENAMLEQNKLIKFKEDKDVVPAPDDPFTIGFIGTIKNIDGTAVVDNPFGEETYKIRLRVGVQSN